MKIQQKLAQWLQAGLLSVEQVEAIQAFEVSQPKSHWWLYSVMVLGASVVALGVISLIATNWVFIPSSVKLGLDFAILLGLALGVYVSFSLTGASVWFEVAVAGFVLMCLASIGLIAQIYHSGGQLTHALVFWAALTLPVVLFARQFLTLFVWFSLALHALIWALVDWVQPDSVWWDGVPAMFLLAPLLSGFLYVLSRFVRGTRSLSGIALFWVQMSAVVSLWFIDVLRSAGGGGTVPLSVYMPALVCMVGVMVGIVVLPHYRLLSKAVLIGAVGLLVVYYLPDTLFHERRFLLGSDESVRWWQADDIRAVVLTFAILGLYGIHTIVAQQQMAFNVVTFLIGVRFVSLYFQAMGGLAMTGVGLIVSGVFMMGLAWSWFKWRGALQLWAREVIA